MIDKSFYDSDYYEDGIASGKSLYVNYRWMEKGTMELMHLLTRLLGIKSGMKVLDYGCAKGFLVYAFRKNNISAYGVDISQYATSKCFEEIKEYIKCIDVATEVPFEWGEFDFVIAKDVFEHIKYENLKNILIGLAKRAKNLFLVVPLGNGVKYIDPDQELDASHTLRESLEWWVNTLNETGWNTIDVSTYMPDIKPRCKPGTQAFLLAVKST